MDEINNIPENIDRQGGYMTELRDFIGSGKVLTMAIMLGTSIFFMISGGVIGSKTILVQYAQILEELGVDPQMMEEYYDMVNRFGAGSALSSLIGAIIGNIPLILVFAGFMLTWSAARQAGENRMSTTGLGLLKVMNIIGIVGYGLAVIGIVIAVIGFALFGAMLGGEIMGDSMGALAGVLVVVVVISLIFSLGIMGLYIAKNVGLHNTITKLESAVNGEYSAKKISTFAMVMIIIAGVSTGFNALTAIATLNFLSVIGGALRAAYLIMLGININSIKSIITSYNG